MAGIHRNCLKSGATRLKVRISRTIIHRKATDPKVVKFVTEYKRRYNETPDALAACGYDGARIMFEAIKRAGVLDRAKLRDALAQTKDFDGVTGTISIDTDRNAVKPAAILEVKNGGTEFVKTVAP